MEICIEESCVQQRAEFMDIMVVRQGIQRRVARGNTHELWKEIWHGTWGLKSGGGIASIQERFRRIWEND